MVRFLGQSPNFQIYPNTSRPEFLQLRFSKIQERDASGALVQGHAVTSLASADPYWMSGNVTAADGTNYTYVTMVLDPRTRQSFSATCPNASATASASAGGSGSGSTGGASASANANVAGHHHRRLLRLNQAAAERRSLATDPNDPIAPLFKVTVFFGLDNSTTFPFGKDKTVSVAKGGLKFNVEYMRWPFCSVNNTLSLEIDLAVKNAGAANTSVSTGADGSKTLAVALSNDTASNITFANYAYEAQNGTRSMAVGVNLTTTGSGASAASTVVLTLPNPAPNASAYYDPTVTAAYSTQGGAAAGMRVGLWGALAALLLAAFMSA
ncbi:hypothetical protein HYH02_004317 [Chlamydomonas schloesseri]|uniref:Uncharacterized protein n=1 Tax=Chlamydomonas schloesseri TaxID=2026947 RepID=A0A835WNH7_9CHLO|nr:hypothetical protein HYH02_004317 [Chlamydomonas schloesseri]|eukprot:KAG2451049.1 hypothetical protein HYH02_004317 [Chlamydomonas schloesseri]